MEKIKQPPKKKAEVVNLKPNKKPILSIGKTNSGALAARMHKTKTASLPEKREAKEQILQAIDSDFCMAYLGSTPVLIHDYDKSTKRPVKTTKLNTEGYLDYLTSIPYKLQKTTPEGGTEWARREFDGFALWKKSPFSNRKDAVIYDPSTKKESENYNLWTGYYAERITEAPCKNYPKIFEKYIYEALAPKEPKAAEYIINWLAHMLQHPEVKPAVAIVAYSTRKGTGKSLLADIIFEVVGRHSIRLASSHQLLGKFTGHLSDKQFVNAEESAFAGSSKAGDELKNLISSQKQFLEKKGKDGFEVDSFVRLYITSNHLHSVQVSSDERRFLVVNNDESPYMHKDHFFADVAITPKKTSIDGVAGKPNLSKVRALYNYLMERDISEFNPSDVPDTLAMSEQKLLSEAPLESFCKHVMAGRYTRNLPGAESADYWFNSADKKIWFKKTAMLATFLEYEKQFHSSKRSHVTDRSMYTHLKNTKLLPTHIRSSQGRGDGHTSAGIGYWVFDFNEFGQE